MNRIPKDMQLGSKFSSNGDGDFTVIAYHSYEKVLIEFIDTGCKIETTTGQIRQGSVKDKLKPTVYGVGFVGCGEHKPTICGVITEQYAAWHGMVRRCYSKESLERYPTYNGCTVCSEWLNFQTFADWFDNNKPNCDTRINVDKDIKLTGNRVYCPEYCSIVPQAENIKESNKRRWSNKNG